MIPYNDIYDCPIDPFHSCQVDLKNLRLLIKEGEFKESDTPVLFKKFELINDQKIDIFGVTPEFEIFFYKQRDVLKKEIEVLNGDRAAITFLNSYKSDLERIKETLLGDKDLRKYHARLHRIIQTRFVGRDTHKITVFEFYNDIQDITVEQREREKEEIFKHGKTG